MHSQSHSLTVYDISLMVLTVVVACTLPRIPGSATCHAVMRLVVCVLVIALCVCLPHYGVALSLLLVLSYIPTLQLLPLPFSGGGGVAAAAPRMNVRDAMEAFANPANPKEKLRKFSAAKMGEEAIAEKMSLFSRINSKQDAFKKQMTEIDKNLKNVKEFYANESSKFKKNASPRLK